jgi:hypothetical protein
MTTTGDGGIGLAFGDAEDNPTAQSHLLRSAVGRDPPLGHRVSGDSEREPRTRSPPMLNSLIQGKRMISNSEEP